MNVVETALQGVLVVEPKSFPDARGEFVELFRNERYAAAGITGPFVQDNLSVSRKGVLRGLHFQNPHPQQKLVSVVRGETFSVAVDVRRSSPTFGKWISVRLSMENHRQLFVPEGFAHGFVALEDVVMIYKVNDTWHPESERTIAWDDPDIGIEWPIADPMMSPKDAAGLRLRDMQELFD